MQLKSFGPPGSGEGNAHSGKAVHTVGRQCAQWDTARLGMNSCDFYLLSVLSLGDAMSYTV